jgi:hypothetical protein
MISSPNRNCATSSVRERIAGVQVDTPLIAGFALNPGRSGAGFGPPYGHARCQSRKYWRHRLHVSKWHRGRQAVGFDCGMHHAAPPFYDTAVFWPLVGAVIAVLGIAVAV